MENRQSLEQEVLRWLDESDDTDVIQANVQNALKQTHTNRINEENWPFMLWHKPQTISIVSGQTVYSLHSEYAKPLYFRDSTNSLPMKQRASDNVIPTNTNEIGYFTLWNRAPIANQPTSTSVLTIVSNNAGDNLTTQGIFVRGETSDGVTSEVIVPNGTTPVNSVNSYLPGGILEVAKVGTWQGKMTMTSNSGAVTNLVLFASEKGKSYQQIKLLWTPTSNFTMEYLFYRKAGALDQDYSIPDIPDGHQRILVWDALILLAAYDGRLDDMRLVAWKEQQQKMDDALRAEYQDAMSLQSEMPLIHDIEDD